MGGILSSGHKKIYFGGYFALAAFHSGTPSDTSETNARMPTTNLTLDPPMATNTPTHATFPSSTTTLNRAVIKATLIAVVIGMGIYTAIEFSLARPSNVAEFLGHHLLHALVIGVVISIALTVLLDRFIVAPVRRIFQHLYHIGSGRLAPLELDSKLEEVNTVVGGINLLVERLKNAPSDKALVEALIDVGKLRAKLEAKVGAAGSEADDFVPIMRDLCNLEGDLLAVAGPAIQKA